MIHFGTTTKIKTGTGTVNREYANVEKGMVLVKETPWVKRMVSVNTYRISRLTSALQESILEPQSPELEV